MPIPSSSIFSLPPPPPSQGRGPLHAGSTWEGVQRSGRSSFAVRVSLDQVDLERGTLCGLLSISGLTPQLENLTTFFDGEIVGGTHGFRTGRWGATEQDDIKHWSRFSHFRPCRSQMTGDDWTYNGSNKPAIFMRWKERYVVSNGKSGREDRIHGASYSGFYYVCLSLPDEPLPTQSPTLRTRSPFSQRRTSLDAYSFAGIVNTPPSSPPLASSASSFWGSRTRASSPPTLQPNSPTTASANPHRIEERPAEEDREREGRSTRPQPIPMVPRRSSSYAEAVRTGRLSGQSTPIAIPSSPTLGNTDALSTPKEMDGQANVEFGDSPFAPSSVASGSSLGLYGTSPSAESTTSRGDEPCESDLSPPVRSIEMPTAFGLTFDEFPPPMWPTRSEREPSQRARSSSGSASRFGAGGRSASSVRGASADRGAARQLREEERVRPDYGMKSWAGAEIRGFYFFRCSEPFQELSLKFVPQARGGSEAFEFR